MNRREFLKGAAGAVAVAALPLRVEAERVIGVDPAAGEDRSAVLLKGKSVGTVWNVHADGGYLITDELAEQLKAEMQPLAKFNHFKGVGRG